MIDIESSLVARLPHNTHMPFPPPEPGIKSSAVLVPLLREDTGWTLLFTRRGEQLAEHGGQVSFPGGRAEAGDPGPLQTALREACEETGISAEEVRPLGILSPTDTDSGFRIWPVVGILHGPVELRPSSPEVREIFFVPLEWLVQPGRYEWRMVKSSGGEARRRALFFEPFQGQVIWGATAAITLGLMEILIGRWTS